MANGMTRVSFLASATAVPESTTEAVSPPPEGDFDTVARAYLGRLFEEAPNESLARARSQIAESAEAPAGASELPGKPRVDLKSLQDQPLTGTVFVKYRQIVQNVPVYGAEIAVELTPDKKLVSLSGQVSMPLNVDPVARLSPADARSIVKDIAKIDPFSLLGEIQAPELVYRFDAPRRRWVLAYQFNNVRIREPQPPDGEDTGDAGHGDWDREFSNYKLFLDANTGEEIIRVPVHHLLECTGLDAQGIARTFDGLASSGKFLLIDQERKIRTQSLSFGDVNCGPKALPGDDIASDSSTFASPAAVAAHYNATQVYDFYKNVMRRNSLDGRGMTIVSSVDCLDYKYDYDLGFCRVGVSPPSGNIWKNAAWIGTQIIYGQAPWTNGSLRSFAEALDVVGHEMTHAVTQHTADLEYVTESGALNESYSDIMGIAIANAGKPIANWDWRLGSLINADKPLRRMDNPSDTTLSRPQPSHMDGFRHLPPGAHPGQSNDQGFVHGNSGIHNKAAYNLFTNGVLTPDDVAKLFYLTLSGRLTATATFADSKQGMLDSCQVLFQASPDLASKLSAIKLAFEDVGI